MTNPPFALGVIVIVFSWSFTEAQWLQIEPNGTIQAVSGENLNVSCHSSVSSSDRLKWLHENGTYVTTNKNHRVHSTHYHTWYGALALLRFNPLLSRDSYSVYRCWYRANSTEYSESVSINVTDGYPPSFKTEFDSYEYVEGDNVYLTCQADGYPRPVYSWLDNFGRNMRNSSGNWQVSTEGWLSIRSINSSQEGTYTCIATNEHGTASKLHLINVSQPTYLDRASVLGEILPSITFTFTSYCLKETGSQKAPLGGVDGHPPSFETYGVSYEYMEGDNVYLECRADGQPRPEYTWLDNFGRYMYNNTGSQNGTTDGWLRIYSINISQSGNYTCIATNPLGTAEQLFVIKVSRNAKLNVIVKELWQTLVRFAINFEIKDVNYQYIYVRFETQKLPNSTWATATWTVGEDYIVTDLMPGSTYIFTFGVKQDRYSEVILLHDTELELTLPSFLPLLIIRKVQDGMIDVEFPRQSFLEFNGYLKPLYFIFRYVKLRQKSGSFYEEDCPITIEIPTCFGRSYVIQAASSGYYYKLQLSAMLQDGPSNKSEVIVRAM